MISEVTSYQENLNQTPASPGHSVAEVLDTLPAEVIHRIFSAMLNLPNHGSQIFSDLLKLNNICKIVAQELTTPSFRDLVNFNEDHLIEAIRINDLPVIQHLLNIPIIQSLRDDARWQIIQVALKDGSKETIELLMKDPHFSQLNCFNVAAMQIEAMMKLDV